MKKKKQYYILPNIQGEDAPWFWFRAPLLGTNHVKKIKFRSKFYTKINNVPIPFVYLKKKKTRLISRYNLINYPYLLYLYEFNTDYIFFKPKKETPLEVVHRFKKAPLDECVEKNYNLKDYNHIFKKEYLDTAISEFLNAWAFSLKLETDGPQNIHLNKNTIQNISFWGPLTIYDLDVSYCQNLKFDFLQDIVLCAKKWRANIHDKTLKIQIRTFFFFLCKLRYYTMAKSVQRLNKMRFKYDIYIKKVSDQKPITTAHRFLIMRDTLLHERKTYNNLNVKKKYNFKNENLWKKKIRNLLNTFLFTEESKIEINLYNTFIKNFLKLKKKKNLNILMFNSYIRKFQLKLLINFYKKKKTHKINEINEYKIALKLFLSEIEPAFDDTKQRLLNHISLENDKLSLFKYRLSFLKENLKKFRKKI